MATQKQEEYEFSIVLHEALSTRACAVGKGHEDPDYERPIVRAHIVAELASKLVRAAKSLHRRYEAECSYEWADTDAYRSATERKEKAVAKLMKPYGIDCVFNGDPRGAPIKLKLPTGKTNDWGGEGYCVPY